MDITYANNLGTWTFQRCVVSVTDSWEWSGRSVHRSKQIQIDGWMSRDASERFEQMLTNPDDPAREKGVLGTLTVPWAVLTNIKLMNASQPENYWHDLVQYTATFADEFPEGNLYTMTFFGMTLHNPRLFLSIPTAEMRDEYPQMQLQNGLVWNPNTVGAGVMRTKAAPGCMEISLSGTIRTPDGQLPNNWLSLISRRAGMDVSSISGSIPSGWPLPFNLTEAVPELLNAYTLNGCIMSRGHLLWNVEEGTGQLQLEMIAQPQSMGVV